MLTSTGSHSAKVEVAGSRLWLLPQKAAYLEAEKALLIADLHLGKANHFRLAGIPIPGKANEKNLERLIEIVQITNPDQVIFMGDLFHSYYNHEWESLGQVISSFKSCHFHLVKGNHDIMSEQQYERYHMDVNDQLTIGKIILSHEQLDEIRPGYYNLSGHVHPGVRLLGKGRQSITLPCFYFGINKGLLPAFGALTGLARIKVESGAKVFLVAEDKVLEMKHE